MRINSRMNPAPVSASYFLRPCGPLAEQYVLPLTMALLTSYTVNARYAEPAFGRLTTRALKEFVISQIEQFSHNGTKCLQLC